MTFLLALSVYRSFILLTKPKLKTCVLLETSSSLTTLSEVMTLKISFSSTL